MLENFKRSKIHEEFSGCCPLGTRILKLIRFGEWRVEVTYTMKNYLNVSFIKELVQSGKQFVGRV